MPDPSPTPSDRNPASPTLTARVRDALREQIRQGRYGQGDRLPSEARLTEEFGVSRTVIREAVAGLRSDRLVEPRQGAGVFVLPPPAETAPPFQNLDLARVSSLIEMLELRTAVEGDAAGLAALRRSPAQEERMLEAEAELRQRAAQGQPSAEADFRFHLAIAEAANNPRFSEFLTLIGKALIPRMAVSEGEDPQLPPDYQATINAEHAAILSAIQSNDEDGARAAMRQHLKNSQTRYRNFLRQARG